MKKLIVAALTIAFFAVANPVSAKPEDHIKKENPMPSFGNASLNIICGKQSELENFIAQGGERPVLKGRSSNPSTASAPVIMTMNANGHYTLYAVNPEAGTVCVLDYGQMIRDEAPKIES